MTINLDNTQVTLDFVYEDGDIEVEGEVTCYKVRFHHTVELGDTISISDHGSEYFSYPARMFIEIGDFLKEQKIVKKHQTVVPKKTQPQAQIQSKIGDLLEIKSKEDEEVSGFGGLVAPAIEGEIDILSQETEEEQQESLSADIINKYAEGVEGLPEPDVQEEKSEGTISEEDVEKQWLLRERMANKPVDPEKVVKRKAK